MNSRGTIIRLLFCRRTFDKNQFIEDGIKTCGPFSSKNTINSYGCLRYSPRKTIANLFRKKNSSLENAIKLFCYLQLLHSNSTYMKKGSLTSKLNSPFFIQSKFKLFRQGQLPRTLIHYCRFLPRGGGCCATGFD